MDLELESEWSKNYFEGRRQSEKMVFPEEKLISQEENPVWKAIITIYLEQGVDSLINYFFSNLKFKKFETAEVILEFFDKITRQLPLKVSSRIEKRLLREAQIESYQTQNNNYNMRLGKVLFGRDKFLRMVNNRV